MNLTIYMHLTRTRPVFTTHVAKRDLPVCDIHDGSKGLCFVCVFRLKKSFQNCLRVIYFLKSALCNITNSDLNIYLKRSSSYLEIQKLTKFIHLRPSRFQKYVRF